MAIVPNDYRNILAAVCPEEISNGILWPKTQEGNPSSRPCALAGSRFRLGNCYNHKCLHIIYYYDA